MAEQNQDLYPLLFRPVFKERIWGGRRLERYFTDLPAGPVGEAWVLSDHPQGPTRVANGPLAGQSLADLKRQFGASLLGANGISSKTGEFPLLFKLLDAQEDLSVQVHPTDDYQGLPAGELGKTEMWVVLDAEPGAKAVYGLRPGITADGFASAVRAGKTMAALNQIEVQPGDVLYVPAGTVHALGAGLLVAEIQQSSDTVYRVYDYDRPGLDGTPRELHIDHALKVSTYGAPPLPTRLPIALAPHTWVEICRSPYFTVCYGESSGAGVWAQEPTPGSFGAIMILAGEATFTWPGGRLAAGAGETVLLPAALASVQIEGECKALHASVPA